MDDILSKVISSKGLYFYSIHSYHSQFYDPSSLTRIFVDPPPSLLEMGRKNSDLLHHPLQLSHSPYYIVYVRLIAVKSSGASDHVYRLYVIIYTDYWSFNFAIIFVLYTCTSINLMLNASRNIKRRVVQCASPYPTPVPSPPPEARPVLLIENIMEI